MIERVFRRIHVQRRVQERPLAGVIEDLAALLIERGHSVGTIQQYVHAVEHFDGWLSRTRRRIGEINDTVVHEFFTSHLPRCHCRPPGHRYRHQVRPALRYLLFVMRRNGLIAPPVRNDGSPSERIVQDFVDHLREHRGIAAATLLYRARYALEFLEAECGRRKPDFSHITFSTATRFLVERSSRWTPASMQIVAASLRSFFRFLQLTGRVDQRITYSVPRIANWRLAALPRVLDTRQVDAILASFDRTTSLGMREYASTLCLAELGLRTCEVAALTLDDIDWRASTVSVRASKARRADVLPISGGLARAILAYLRCGRPKTSTRQIFVRHLTPVGAPGTSAIVRNAVRYACLRAGIDPTIATPHAFRHTVATRLLRTGATIKDVADVLRHRSIDTTAIYAKVDMSSLRDVALPWPRRLP